MKIIKNFVIKSLILALPLLFAGALSAAVTNSLKIETDANEKSIYLSFKNDKSESILIQIKDDNEAILHQEKITDQKAFSKKFNLENLPKGVYFLSISDELKDVIQPIEVSDITIKMDPSTRFEHYKPVYIFKNNTLNVNFLALNSNKIKVEISNDQNQQIFIKEFETAGNPFGKRFDLNKLKKGKYTFKIIAKNEVYSKEIDVQ